MIARLICLVVGAAILALGIAQASLALVVLATAIVAGSLFRAGEPGDALRPAASQPGLRSTASVGEGRVCAGRAVLPRALVIVALAAGLTGVTIALGSAETPVWLSIVTWLLAIGALVALGLTLDRLSVRDALAAVRSLLGGGAGWRSARCW